MAKFCGSCGGALRPESRFCAACGASSPAEARQPTAGPQRPRQLAAIGIVGAAAVLTLGLIGGYAAGWFESDQAPVEQSALSAVDAEGPLPQSWFDDYSDAFVSGPVTQFVTGTAQMRNYPTSRGSTIIETLQPGRQVEGRWVEGADPTTRWLRTTDGGYVWDGNLAASAQPAADGNSNQFPVHLRGTWGLRDDCNGADMDMTVTISANTISFYETRGHIISTSNDGKSGTSYDVSMSGEGQNWTANFAIEPSADGRSIFIRELNNQHDPGTRYFDSGLACNQLVRP